jgi:hypothetical protein
MNGMLPFYSEVMTSLESALGTFPFCTWHHILINPYPANMEFLFNPYPANMAYNARQWQIVFNLAFKGLISEWFKVTEESKRIPFIFNDEITGSCICLRLDLYLSHVKIGARHLGSLCSILSFSHKKYPRQETITYVASCIQGMFLVVPSFVARCHYVRKDARDPDGKIWNCESEKVGL